MAVLECWRRGPVKEHHAGLASDEIGLFGVCRFSTFEVNKIMQYASTTLPMELTQHSAWDKRVQSLYLQYHPKYPDSWSVTDETADVLLAGPADIEAVRDSQQNKCSSPRSLPLRLCGSDFSRSRSGTV